MKSTLAALACTAAVTLTGCGQESGQQSAQSPTPVEVGVVRAEATNAPLTKDFVGRLAPFRSADVRARVAGVLMKRTYEEGTDVKKGQVLFEIDPASVEATLAARQAELAQAQATYANSKATAERSRKLASQGFISQAALDEVLSVERTAAAAVQQARATVRSARINLDLAKVTAPIDGRAGKQQVTEGALVGQNESTLLTTIEQIDPVYVNFTISTADLTQLRTAQREGTVTLADRNQATVQIVLPDGTPYGERGTIDFADAAVNPGTGAMDLRARIPNPERRVLPGMYVTIKANLGQQNNVFLIPQAAIQGDTAGPYVMVVGQDGKVARKPVTVAGMSGGDFVVGSGLAPGDQVIVSGLQQVNEDSVARTVPWQPPASGAAAPAQPAAAAPGGEADR
ncbi:MAG: efflux RND transporter periplasmic adaptor subunit [Burkholderiales bacterium]|nr:efflux RND transporter periplasmic adaptor subunit [Burkholderiales bacterium]